jgi:hypothetical protein
VRALRAVLPVDIVAVDAAANEPAKYDRMIRYHRRAIDDAMRDGAALVFLAPDHVISAGTLARLAELRARGYRAVVCPGMWLARESMEEALAAHGDAALPPRTLVGLALRHLHPSMRDHMADAGIFSPHPTSVYWRVGTRGLLARCMTLHPLMIDPVRPVLPKKEIDGSYLSRCVPDLDQVHVVADSDELVIFEMTRAQDAKAAPGRRSWSKIWRAAGVAVRCDAHQLAFWRQPIRVHAEDIDSTWAEAEAEAARFASAVSRRVPYVRALLPLTDGLSRWRQRLDRRRREWRRVLPRIRLKQIRRPAVVAMHQARKRLHRAFKALVHVPR